MKAIMLDGVRKILVVQTELGATSVVIAAHTKKLLAQGK
jgi:hypothetical protein